MEKPTAKKPKRRLVSRRNFIRGLVVAGAAGAGLGAAISPNRFKVTTPVISIENLPKAFDGFRIALLTDIHHGPSVTIKYVERIVARTNRLAPDLILLGGDYVYNSSKYIAPCAQRLIKLKAPAGVFFILGNHDHWNRSWPLRKALRENGIRELINKGVTIERNGDKIYLAGVDDLWTGIPHIDHFLEEIPSDAVCILGSHNPDFAESINDPRVKLILSGHTHGGQIYLPGIGAPVLPSKYGQKYCSGLVKNVTSQVYVSRGLGTLPPKLRLFCSPELPVITLKRA